MKKEQFSLFDVEQAICNSGCKKASQILSPSCRKILQLLTQEGINKTVTASLLELAGANKQIVQYVAGPVITQQNGWQNSIPAWVWNAIAVDRLNITLNEIDQGKVGKLASSSEVLALMMPITLEVPLQNNWTDVYLWASYDTLAKHKPYKDYDYEKIWQQIGTIPIEYKTIKSDYEEIAADIRSRVIVHAAERGWGKKSSVQGRQTTEKSQTNQADKVVEQLSLF
jgi:hypothetical protein